MADQAIVRNNRVQALVNHQQYRLPSSQSRNPHAQLQYALNELHLGDVKVPPEICSSNVPGCVTEFIPPITTHASYTSRLSHVTHVTSAQQSIETVTEEGCNLEEQQKQSKPPPRRGRRSAVDAMVHMNNSRRHTVQGPPAPDTLYVPANHPLLRQETPEQPPETNEFANRVKIQIIEPTAPVSEQTSMSMTLNNVNNAQPNIVPISPLAHKEIGFKEGRRASDGVNAPFRHLLHKSENRYFKEYQELQLLQRSLTPDQINQQLQMNHNLFIESGGHMPQTGPDWKSSPMSSQNELMMTLQSMHLANQDNSICEQESWNAGPGPCRRPPYRKMSGGYSPIPAHIRKRRTPVLGDSPFSSFDSGTGIDD